MQLAREQHNFDAAANMAYAQSDILHEGTGGKV